MNILWITFAPIKQQNGILTSDMASMRYRVIIPARYLATKQTYQQGFLTTPKQFDINNIAPIVNQQDIIIFSKSFNLANEQIALYAKNQGVKVIFDICDNHFESTKLAQRYKNLVYLADKIVVNTPLMAEIVKHHTNKAATIIPDPYEGQQYPPYFQPNPKQLNLLWFGSHTNLDSLQAMIPTLVPLSQKIPLKLHIITSPNMGMEQACQQFNEQSECFQLQFSAWSLETTQRAIQQADIVTIPSMPNERKIVKSPNRLIESLWAGRFVVAHPLPSYQEFAQWAWINENLTNGIVWALQNPTQVTQNAHIAQQYIAQNYSPEKIGLLWEKIIDTS